MKQPVPNKILSLFLALALLITSIPPVAAAEATDPTEPVSVLVTEPAETEAAVTEPVETVPAETEAIETEPVETEPVETEPAVTEPVETEAIETEPVETEPVETEPVETEPVETEPVEETEPAALPYGLPGLPADYVLSEKHLALKETMIQRGELDTLATLIPGENYKEGELIVPASSEEDAAIVAAAFGGELVRFSRNYAIVQLSGVTVYQALEASLNPELPLPAASPNYITKVEPISSASNIEYSTNSLPREQSWYDWVKENGVNDPFLQNPRDSRAGYYQWMHDAVDTYSAWSVTMGDPWVKVAVIDTGVNANHEDLKGKVTSVNLRIGNTYLGTADSDGHGTHVAGIIGATAGNGKGGAGIAPGVSILGIRVTDAQGYMYDEYIAEGIYAAIDRGAHIINMSLGGVGCAWVLEEAVRDAIASGVTVIASMGNTGSNTINYPGALNGVIAVCATDRANSRAHFSNYAPWADISAPGEAINSTVANPDNANQTNLYDVYDGTSMAAPVVAGVAALYTSAMGERVKPAVMEKALKASATKIVGSSSGMGAGIVNAAKMLDDKPDVPYYLIWDGENFYDARKTVPCDATVWFFESEEVFMNDSDEAYGDQNSVFLFTLDGTNPSIKNGEVVNGILTTDEAYLELADYAGSTVTIKVARISGMGMVGKTLTLKLKVGTGDYVDGVAIHGAKTLVAGKSTTYTATVYPAETANQAVTWSIVTNQTDSYLRTATINAKTGKLTTPKGKTGYITIKATSVADPNYYATLRVRAEAVDPVAKITLSHSSFICYSGYYFDLSIASMVDTSGYGVNPNLSGVRWTSSNPKVAEVDQDGRVYCYTKGNVTITCMSLDGSNKKATCKVQIRQAVEDITITGQRTIQSGTSATFKATVAPKDAHAKKVTWDLYNAPPGVTISSTGKVTVPSYVSNRKTFYVVATATDDVGVSVSYEVTVLPKCAAVYIGHDVKNNDTGYAAGPEWGAVLTRDSNKNPTAYIVKSVNLFSLDLDHSSGVDNAVKLGCYFAGHTYTDDFAYEWSSSNPSIATVDSNGYVVAHKAGTAKITATALDGSNKKHSVNVKVTNPASTISISTNIPSMMSSTLYLAIGKSATHKAVFAETYGKPTNQKVNWDFSVYRIYNGQQKESYTEYFKSNKLITINSSGTLSVKAGVQKEWDRISDTFQVNVKAQAADGSGALGYISYTLIPPTTVMKEAKKYDPYFTGSGYLLYFHSNQVHMDGHAAAFTATSSNPKVVSLYEDRDFPTVFWVKYDSSVGMNLYAVYITLPGGTGNARVTVKAADGTNKSCSLSIRVT